MSVEEKHAIELKLLLSGWKLEKLYETFKDEDIFIEELEMMTMEHLETILKDYKMGVRIRFEHFFKKWRTAIGAPLINDATVEECSNCSIKDNFTDKKSNKLIVMSEKETQTEAVMKLTQIASTQTSSESTIVKIRHGANQLREVLNKINKSSPNYQQFPNLKSKSKAETANEATVTSDVLIEQPSTTTKCDATTPAAAPVPSHTFKIHHTTFTPSVNVSINKSLINPLSSNLLPTAEDNVVATTSAIAAATVAKPIAPAPRNSPPAVLLSTPESTSIPHTEALAKVSTATPDTAAKKIVIPKASLKRRQTLEATPAAATDFSHSNITILRKHGINGLQQHKKLRKTTENPIVDILLAEGNRGLQLLQRYDENQAFISKDRDLLVQIIIAHYHKHDLPLSPQIADKIVDDILKQFPSEQLEYYESPKHGKMYKQFFQGTQQPVHTTEAITLSDSSDPDN